MTQRCQGSATALHYALTAPLRWILELRMIQIVDARFTEIDAIEQIPARFQAMLPKAWVDVGNPASTP